MEKRRYYTLYDGIECVSSRELKYTCVEMRYHGTELENARRIFYEPYDLPFKRCRITSMDKNGEISRIYVRAASVESAMAFIETIAHDKDVHHCVNAIYDPQEDNPYYKLYIPSGV